MSYVKWKVQRNAFSGTTWSETTTDVVDFYDPILEVNAGDKKDSFSLKLNNPNGIYDNVYQPNDKLTISRVTNSDSFSTDDIKMIGVIRDVPTDSSGSKDEVRLEGYNFSEAITTALVFYDAATNKSPLEIVKEAISTVALQNSNFAVTWDTTNNPLLYKKDGTTLFPTLKKRYFYVPLSKVIEEMLSDKYTEDGTYMWWVDNENKFQVRSNAGGDAYSYNIETDTDTINYKDGKDIKDVKNFIILKGGTDPSGKQLQVVLRDYSSISKHGMRYYYAVSQNTYAENLNKLDVGKESTTRYPTTYPFTTNWKASYTGTVEGVSVVEGNTIEVTSDLEYKEVLREEALTQLKAEAQQIIDGTKFGKLKVDITVRAGSKDWLLGDRITCTIPKISDLPKVLRVREIQYTSDTDTYSLEEDIGTL